MKIVRLSAVKEFKERLFLARPVFLKTGAVLVKEGTLLDSALISRLKRHKITSVFVTSQPNLSFSEILPVPDTLFFELFEQTEKIFHAITFEDEDRIFALSARELRLKISQHISSDDMHRLLLSVQNIVEYMRKVSSFRPLLIPMVTPELSETLAAIYGLFLFLLSLLKTFPIYRKPLPNTHREKEFIKLCTAVLLRDISLFWTRNKPKHHEKTSAYLLKHFVFGRKPFFSGNALSIISAHHTNLETATITTSNINFLVSLATEIVENRIYASGVVEYFKRSVDSSFKYTSSQFLSVLSNLNIYVGGEQIFIKRTHEIEQGQIILSYEPAVVVGSSFSFLRPVVALKDERINLRKKEWASISVFIERNGKFYNVQDSFEKFIDYLEFKSAGYRTDAKKYSRAYIQFLQRLQETRKQIEQEEKQISAVAKEFIERLESIKREAELQSLRQRIIKKLKLYIDGKHIGEYTNIDYNPHEGRLEEIL